MMSEFETDRDGSSLGREIMSICPEGTAQVSVTYSGCGDEGTYEDFECLDAEGNTIEVDDATASSISESLIELVNDYHLGWEQSEGASGTITLNVLEKSFKIDHKDYYVECIEFTNEGTFE